MAQCDVIRELDDDKVVLKLFGCFDGQAAVDLRDRLFAERSDEVVLDFTFVREFHDLGVAILAHGIAGIDDDTHLLLRGLRNHQLRMFKYFGIDVEELTSAREDTTRSVAEPMDPETVTHL
jgi:anti-anti-sigma regulatory factor